MRLHKSKTFWAGLASIITAIGGVFTGTIDAGTAIQTGFTGLLAIFLRSGILKIND